ncbi:MAG: FAD binding domain-containing protein [Azoarcus sp.]|nr:FAD binding domain-containing protein [Azoarcus sp.]
MKPAAFDWVRIDAVEEACALLAEYGGDARVLAGGQSLMAVLNMRLAQPRVLLDISRCVPLDHVRSESGMLTIGAAATQAAVEWRAHLATEVPLLAQAIPHVSHFQIRNRGTVCGSVAHADPSAELPLCLALLGGEVVLRSRKGRRVLAAGDFFRGMLTTARRDDELVEAVRFPLARAGAGYAFDEFAMRHGDFAIAACAAEVTAERLRLAVGGVADRPSVIEWARLDGDALSDAINDFAWSLEAQDDAHASAAYRRHLVRRMAPRVIAAAEARRNGETR